MISPEGDKALVAFKYKRFVRLCYRCSMLGHEEKFCIVPSEMAEGENLYEEWIDRKSTRLNSSHLRRSRMPSSA